MCTAACARRQALGRGGTGAIKSGAHLERAEQSVFWTAMETTDMIPKMQKTAAHSSMMDGGVRAGQAP